MATGKTKASHGHGDLRTCKNAFLRNSAPTWYYHIMIPRPKSCIRNIGNVIKRRRRHVRNGSDRSRSGPYFFFRGFVYVCIFSSFCVSHSRKCELCVCASDVSADCCVNFGLTQKFGAFTNQNRSRKRFSVEDNAIL